MSEWTSETCQHPTVHDDSCDLCGVPVADVLAQARQERDRLMDAIWKQRKPDTTIADLEIICDDLHDVRQERDEANKNAAKWHQRMLVAQSHNLTLKAAVRKAKEQFSAIIVSHMDCKQATDEEHQMFHFAEKGYRSLTDALGGLDGTSTS